ncbi:PTS sugar transporter subunit IIA [Rhodopila sp.]|uniref:PTS sugar transporter subunit IIA n=1 Tax=Rhodopila sp. TaxID=2480087 RepID=UPI003D0FA512
MDIADLLTPDRIVLDARARDKAQLMGEIGRTFRRLVPALQPDAVEAALMAREQLGSTGLGAGFALPHARLEGVQSYLGLLLRLARPIDFDAIDAKPVRLVFVLLIPASAEASHVAALAAISRRFRDQERVARLVKAETPDLAFEILTDN